MKKIYLFLLLLATMTGCQKDELQIETTEKRSESILEEIPFNSLPPNLNHFLESRENRKSPLSEREFGRFGSVKKNIPVRKTQNEVGVISYTFALSKVYPSNAQPYYFDNLVITELSDREKALILRYFPNSSMKNRSFSGYSGKIEFYDLDGNKLGSISLLDGAQVHQKQNYKMDVTTCEYQWYELCTGGDCVYGVNETCTTENVFDDGSSTGGGSTDEPSGGGGGTTTSPIPDEEEETNTNNLEEEVVNLLLGKDKCVYDKLKNTNGDLFQKTIGVFENNDNYTLTIGYGSCSSAAATACANGGDIENGNVQIKIQDSGNSSLDLASTLLHEGIHAEIYKYVHEHRIGTDPENRKNLLYYYFHYKAKNGLDVGTTEAQHQYMADNFVKPIAKAIQQLDNYKYSIDFYMGFGWDGLRSYGYDGYYDDGKWVSLDKTTSSEYYQKQKEVMLNTTFNKENDGICGTEEMEPIKECDSGCDSELSNG